MAAFIDTERHHLSLMSGDGPHNVPTLATNALIDPRTGAAVPINSPLQIFVKAKKKINDIYVEIEEYVKSAVEFMAELEAQEQIISSYEVSEICAYIAKVKGIRDVLLRDHMKVAFFGRTSNGKSTVINAMLRDKILPSGIGHTTNCFLQVEGSDTHEAYLITDGSEEKQNVKSVGQLAHALCKEKLSESQLVHIYWPRDKCLLLRDDVVFVDSPGVDVTPNLDEWIDKHCLDADVFVLVANAESTLMVTEKNFFHKVSSKLSKPNIFILNNRWDASASEPEYLDQVRRQHQERAVDFLVNELKVCSGKEAEERIFFISAKEALQARLAEQGMNASVGTPTSGPPSFPAEGFQTRYFEFQDFERRFEECISKSAVRTKFEQHCERGRYISGAIKSSMDRVLESSASVRDKKVVEREKLREMITVTERGLAAATRDTKDMISRTVEDVEQRVSRALNDEIRRLAVLVDEFSVPFHQEPLVLNVYKRELHAHVERGLGSNLRARLSAALATNVEQSQAEMIERIERLIPENAPARKLTMSGVLVQHNRRPFELLYRLNCDNLCADFTEDLEFRFTWGITALIQRFCTPTRARRIALKDSNRDRSGPERPLSIAPLDSPDGAMPVSAASALSLDEWSVVSRIALLSGAAGTQGTFGGLILGGFLMKTVGWRLIALTGVIYACLYAYERLTWTTAAKERQFKKQYVQHATKKLRLIVDLTSANCSHQVQQELSGTFARLCHAVDEATGEMAEKLQQLENDVAQLEEAAAGAKVLRNKANYLQHELDLFEDAYLKSHDR